MANPHPSPSIEILKARIASRSRPDKNGCILWAGCTIKFGYGHMRWMGKQYKVHRLAWIAANGPIPAGLCVCHRCDIPNCVNVNHLWLGTNAENTADKIAKGRSVYLRGEACPPAKLSSDQAREIFSASGTFKSIGDRFGVTPSLVNMIKKKKAWKHLHILNEVPSPARRVGS